VRLNKLCEAEDFVDPELLAIIREMHPADVARYGPDWPRSQEMRKQWEVAMAVLAFRRQGVLREDAIVLGIGAGVETTLFYLANHVRWVFATDLYADAGKHWRQDAPPAMLTDPESQSPFPIRPGHLITQNMDGRKLRHEDNTFDGIFSSSSIEHFGGWSDVAAAAREMGRVLKPGGMLSLSTEYRLSGPGKGPAPQVLAFDAAELQELIIEPSGLEPVDDLQTGISNRTLSKVVGHQEQVENVTRFLRGKETHWKTFPHIVLEAAGYRWTSVHLALRKPSA
jgi:SAM-dependent methyltransferase